MKDNFRIYSDGEEFSAEDARRLERAMDGFVKSDVPLAVEFIFTDEEEIRRLNRELRSTDRVTDVLSFPLGENNVYDRNPETGAVLLGDIVISLERAVEQAKLYGHSLQREVAFLTVHSMFHLLGYDHEGGGLEAVRMREKEEAALIQLGLPRTVSYSADQV